jgi:hypothetical protein
MLTDDGDVVPVPYRYEDLTTRCPFPGRTPSNGRMAP